MPGTVAQPRSRSSVRAPGGTTLARLVARVEPDTLLCHSPETAARIAATGQNEARLPGVDLSDKVIATADPAALASATDLVIVATPSAHVRATVASGAASIPASADLLARESKDELVDFQAWASRLEAP